MMHSLVNMSEKACGEAAVKRLLAGNRGHFGCLEHPQIVLNAEVNERFFIEQLLQLIKHVKFLKTKMH